MPALPLADHVDTRVARRLVETDWDTATQRIVTRSKELLDEQGPSALGFYTTASSPSMATAQTVLWSRMLDRLAGPDPPALTASTRGRRRWPSTRPCTSPRCPGPTSRLVVSRAPTGTAG